MGMDCVALKSHAYLAINWGGWEYLEKLLIQLRCPMDEFKHTNDGDIVSEPTARKYGEAIKRAVEGDHVLERAIDDDGSRNPVVLEVVFGCGNPLVIHSTISADEHSVIDLVTGEKLWKLKDEMKEWLLECANFFLNSSGFRQW
jgi:hypothetical protein